MCRPEAKCSDPMKNDCDKNNGVCIEETSIAEGYYCRCKIGFTGNGKRCAGEIYSTENKNISAKCLKLCLFSELIVITSTK